MPNRLSSNCALCSGSILQDSKSPPRLRSRSTGRSGCVPMSGGRSPSIEPTEILVTTAMDIDPVHRASQLDSSFIEIGDEPRVVAHPD